MKPGQLLADAMTPFLGETEDDVPIPCDLPQEMDEGILELADRQPPYPTRATGALVDDGGAGVVEEALSVLADLPRRVGCHRGAAIAAVDQSLEEMNVLIPRRGGIPS
jgi:hypothetical protein